MGLFTRKACALVTLALMVGVGSAARGDEMIRIAVMTGVEVTTVSGSNLTFRPLRADAELQPISSGQAEVRLTESSLTVNGELVEGAGVAFASEGGVRVGPRVLSGEVEVRRAADGLSVVDVLPMETYVAAVTGAEMPPSFPREALLAQTVATRTYAVGKKIESAGAGRDSDLGSTVLDQVYPAQGEPDPRVRAAAEATAGEVLAFEHQVAEAYFFSSCVGRTERGADALGRDLPYLRSVPCGDSTGSPHIRWSRSFPSEELGRLLGLPGKASAVTIARRTSTSRAARVEVSGEGRRTILDGAEFRKRLGYDRLPSLAFSVRRVGNRFVFDGRGSGHGGGMSQWGAAGFARGGKSYREILAHFYPGTELMKMY